MGSSNNNNGSSSEWSWSQNKLFECALAVYDTDTPDRWHNVARYMGGIKSVEEVRRQYQKLVHDVGHIDSVEAPFQWYGAAAPPPARTVQRVKQLRSAKNDGIEGSHNI